MKENKKDSNKNSQEKARKIGEDKLLNTRKQVFSEKLLLFNNNKNQPNKQTSEQTTKNQQHKQHQT